MTPREGHAPQAQAPKYDDGRSWYALLLYTGGRLRQRFRRYCRRPSSSLPRVDLSTLQLSWPSPFRLSTWSCSVPVPREALGCGSGPAGILSLLALSRAPHRAAALLLLLGGVRARPLPRSASLRRTLPSSLLFALFISYFFVLGFASNLISFAGPRTPRPRQHPALPPSRVDRAYRVGKIARVEDGIGVLLAAAAKMEVAMSKLEADVWHAEKHEALGSVNAQEGSSALSFRGKLACSG
ncbi:hypothetical protein B0H16DRAFT_1734603 [Mycena metata]|uniref:Uncharacterized protein n=1 Tax=Mycena metata TaxID=1033252 RepID=A0AAD7HUI0_9AGAR|nr:hypothetical protein B0H16DRAFT_1734603 [Mycena metata]